MSSSRDLIQGDKDLTEPELFDWLKAELACGFAAPDSAYRGLKADTVIERGRPRGRPT
jgi:hypothetical protein